VSDVIAPRSPRHRAQNTQDEEIVDSNDSSGGLVVLAVDDELPALEELAYLLSEDPRVGTVLKASDATDALRILNSRQGVREAATAGSAHRGLADPVSGTRVADRTHVEIVFLDIRMPGLDGLELARVFSSMAVPPSVVFVTAHDDRAVDAYEVGAVDYLLKPIRSERLAASIDRILANRAANVAEPQPEQSTEDEVIPVELGLVDGLGTARGVLGERFPDADLVPVEGRRSLLARLGLGPPAAATSVISTDALLGLAQAAEIRAAWARYGL